VTENFYF